MLFEDDDFATRLSATHCRVQASGAGTDDRDVDHGAIIRVSGVNGAKLSMVRHGGCDNRRMLGPTTRSRRLAMMAGALTVCVLLTVFALRNVGTWLVVSDPLERSPAVAVLAGDVPFRAIEAATLFKDAWASEVWLTRPAVPKIIQDELVRLGITLRLEDSYDREILAALGVPASAIRLIDGSAMNTTAELQLIARRARAMAADRVIIVTSRPHTRRVRATWRSLIGASPRAIVRGTSRDAYDPERWWRHTYDALAVSREFFGLLNVWTGFPLRTYEE